MEIKDIRRILSNWQDHPFDMIELNATLRYIIDTKAQYGLDVSLDEDDQTIVDELDAAIANTGYTPKEDITLCRTVGIAIIENMRWENPGYTAFSKNIEATKKFGQRWANEFHIILKLKAGTTYKAVDINAHFDKPQFNSDAQEVLFARNTKLRAIKITRVEQPATKTTVAGSITTIEVEIDES